MLSHLSFTDVVTAGEEIWEKNGWDDSHRTTISDLRELLNALGWKLGKKVSTADWEKVPPQALVAVQFKETKETWHWVVTDKDDEGLFVIDPRLSVKRDKRRDLNKLSLAWYHRVTSTHPVKQQEQWEIELDREYADTVKWIQNLTPDMPYTEEVDRQWNQYLDYCEKSLLKQFEKTVRKASQAQKLVRRGWVVADFNKGRFSPVLEPDGHDKEDLFPVILQNTGEGRHAPLPLTMALHFHPKVQQLKRQQKLLTPEEEFWKEVNWAKSLRTSDDWEQKDHQANMLAQAAEGLDLMMEPSMGDQGLGWLYQAQQSEHFWDLIQSAIRYGRRWSLHEIFGDGDIEEKVKAALLNPPGKKAGPWRPVLEMAIKSLNEDNQQPTPLKVLNYLKGSRDRLLDANPCTFDLRSLKDLPDISWTTLQGTVKSIRRKK